MKVGIVLRWVDPRLEDWPEDEPLPETLWGPRLRLHNELEIKVMQVVFDLEDYRTGALKRLLVYTGSVKNDMTLRDFPLDIDAVSLQFRTSSDFLTRDEKRSGARVTGQIYQLWWPSAAKDRLR